MTEKLRNFKPFFLFLQILFLINLRQVFLTYYDLPIALRDFHLSNCKGTLFVFMLPCTIKKNSLGFSSFFVQFVLFFLILYDICGGLGFTMVVLVV